MFDYCDPDDELQCKLYQTHHLQLSIFLDDPPEYFKLVDHLCDPADESKKMYRGDQYLRMYLDRAKKQGKSPTHALLSDYGTKLARVRHLVEGLRQARLYEAADYVNKELLNRGPVVRLPGDGDSTSYREFVDQIVQEYHVEAPAPLMVEGPAQPENPNPLDRVINPDSINEFTYSTLQRATHHFNMTPKSEGGALLGVGGFGDVFYARLGSNRVEVAVKRLTRPNRPDDTCLQKKQLNSEFNQLSKFNHVNVLRVLGAAQDGEELCIVYEFIENGTLKDHLKDSVRPLSAESRTKIGLGVGRGLHYLHTTGERPFVHRDIKSANVLLRGDLSPVIGDFGFARYGPRDDRSFVDTVAAVSCYGYIPPEHPKRQIDVVKDVYCYGVILLELLTGREPYDRQTDMPLSEALVGEPGVRGVLDDRAGEWRPSWAQSLWALAWRCLDYEPQQRPSMTQVLWEEPHGLELLMK